MTSTAYSSTKEMKEKVSRMGVFAEEQLSLSEVRHRPCLALLLAQPAR